MELGRAEADAPRGLHKPMFQIGDLLPLRRQTSLRRLSPSANFQIGVNPVSTNDLLHALSDMGLSPVALPWRLRYRLLLLCGLDDIRALRGFAIQGAVALRRCP